MAFSNKVNGHVASGEHLTSALDYYTITTPVNLVTPPTASNNTVDLTDPAASNPDAYYGAPAGSGLSIQNTKTALDKLVEIVSLAGQPIIMGVPTGPDGNGKYSMRFATEHMGSWAQMPQGVQSGVYGAGPQDSTTLNNAAAAALQAAIIKDGIDFGFDANTVVTVSQTL